MFAQAAADSPGGRKGLKARRLFLHLGARFSVLTIFASPWMKEGMLVSPEPTVYSVTHPNFPDILTIPESMNTGLVTPVPRVSMAMHLRHPQPQ